MVLNNEPMFNGWDAPDFKLAILWNGKWHYESIAGHSVRQVQNRDAIKAKEIASCDYTLYVIKDMGKHNKTFVEKEFDIFLKFVDELC